MSAAHAENPFAGQGSVLLDIGDDIGAVVVAMPPSMEGEEVEIRPVPASAHQHHHPHVAVVNRPVAGGEVPSLVFPEVGAGRYGLYPKGTEVRKLTVLVAGGAVVTAQWPC
jgi:hypothetical protein